MPREAPISTAASFDAFLEMEIHAQERHEFVDGNVFVMSGGTLRHNDLVNNIFDFVRPAARKVGVHAFRENVLLKTPDENAYYPDVLVIGDLTDSTSRVVRRPSIIIEVLSESTSELDRTEKLRNYRTIPSLEQYVLVEQLEVLAEVYSKQTDGSWRHEIVRDGASLEFPALNIEIPLSALYENISNL